MADTINAFKILGGKQKHLGMHGRAQHFLKKKGCRRYIGSDLEEHTVGGGGARSIDSDKPWGSIKDAELLKQFGDILPPRGIRPVY
jgi:hypothetical protein